MKKVPLFFCLSMSAHLQTFAQFGTGSSSTPPYARFYDEGTYTFRDSTKLTLNDFLGADMLNNTMKIGVGDNLVTVIDRDMPDAGYHHTQYIQYHNGHPIEGTMINVVSKKGIVMHVNGFWLKDFSLDEPAISRGSEAAALDSALAYIDAPMYAWQDSAMEAGVKIKIDTVNDTTFYDADATLYPKGQLVIAHPYGDTNYTDSTKYALCWKFYITPMKWDTAIIDVGTDTTTVYDTVVGYRSMPQQIVYINVQTGSIWGCNNRLFSSGMSTAYVQPTYYCGNQTIGSNKQGLTYYLWDTDYNIFDFGNHYASSSWIENLGWGENHWHQHTSPTAYWGLQTTNTYFKDVFGVNTSFIANRQDIYTDQTLSLDEYRVGYFNGDDVKISGSGTEDVDMYYFGSDNTHIAKSAAHLDIIAHEYVHSLLKHGPKFDADGETGSVAEALCDYFGSVAASSISSVYSNNWTEGFGYQTNDFARHFYSPLADWPSASIEHYSNYVPGMDVHLGGGIFRKYTSVLETGGTYYGTTVAGIGNQDLNNFRAIYGFFWNHQNYYQTRKQLLEYYEFVYSKCSPQWISCARAWHALGVGSLPDCSRTLVITDAVADAENTNIVQVRGKHAVGGNQPGIRIGKTDEEMIATIVSYQWTIPQEWSITYSTDSSEFGIDSVTDLSSRMVHCIVTFSDSTQDTVTTFMHFNDVTPVQKIAAHTPSSILNGADVKLFPNPVKRQLNIQLDFTPSKGCPVVIFDLIGHVVFSTSINSSDTSIILPELSPGLYICKIHGNDKEYINKLEIRN